MKRREKNRPDGNEQVGVVQGKEKTKFIVNVMPKSVINVDRIVHHLNVTVRAIENVKKRILPV